MAHHPMVRSSENLRRHSLAQPFPYASKHQGAPTYRRSKRGRLTRDIDQRTAPSNVQNDKSLPQRRNSACDSCYSSF